MKTKTIFKFIASLAVGMCLGLLLAAVAIALFTDITMERFMHNLRTLEIGETVFAAVIGIVMFVLCMLIQIIGHEGGHLVGGLLTGYRFVSFRIFSLTLLRREGRWTLRRFSLAGTGGQCIMTPPDGPTDRLPFVIYNAGGVVFNLFTVLLAIAAAAAHPGHLSGLQLMFLIMLGLSGAFAFILNGIPMTSAGMPNDAHNIMTLWRHPESRRHFALQLRVNALAQDGMRLRDMPDEWFEDDLTTPPCNLLHTVTRTIIASRLLDEGHTEEAHDVLTAINTDGDKMPRLITCELRSELIYTSLALGRVEDAARMLTPTLRQYIERSAAFMSSKQRVLCAMALRMDNDRGKAEDILHRVESQRGKYVIEGEVTMDIDLMHKLLA